MFDDIKNLVDLIESSKKTLNELHEQAKKEAREIDQKVNDLYHILEYCALDAVQLAKVTKELREVLKERRQKKERMYVLWGVVDPNSKSSFEKILQNSEKRQKEYAKESKTSYEKLFNKE